MSIPKTDRIHCSFIDSQDRSIKTSKKVFVAGTKLSDSNDTLVNAKTGGFVDAFTTNQPFNNESLFDYGIVDLGHFKLNKTQLYADANGHLVGAWHNCIGGTQVIKSFTFQDHSRILVY